MGNFTFPEKQTPPQKSRHFSLSSVVLTIVLILAGTGTHFWYSVVRACDVDVVGRAALSLVRQRDRYDHTYQFATSASPDAIVRPVAELQQILMDTQEIVVPACMQAAKNELIDYMGTVIRAFQAYGAQEPDSTVRDLINQSETHYDNFAIELETLKTCAPFCIP